MTRDIGVRFRGGDGGNVSPQSLLSLLPPSEAVRYSSSEEKTIDLGVNGVVGNTDDTSRSGLLKKNCFNFIIKTILQTGESSIH